MSKMVFHIWFTIRLTQIIIILLGRPHFITTLTIQTNYNIKVIFYLDHNTDRYKIIHIYHIPAAHCKSRPSQNELHILWKELDLIAWGRQSSKLVWYVSTNNFCFSFPKICRSNVTVHLRTVISLFNVNYKLLYTSIFVSKELYISFFLWEQS